MRSRKRRARRSERISDEQVAESDHAIERRPRIELVDIRDNRRVPDCNRFGQTDRRTRIAARGADLCWRKAGCIEDRLATTPRSHAIARQRGRVLATIGVRFGGGHRQAATTIRHCVMSGAAARVRIAAVRAVRRMVLMAAEESELPVRTQAAGARHAGHDGQGNHSPDNHSRKRCAKAVHNCRRSEIDRAIMPIGLPERSPTTLDSWRRRCLCQCGLRFARVGSERRNLELAPAGRQLRAVHVDLPLVKPLMLLQAEIDHSQPLEQVQGVAAIGLAVGKYGELLQRF